MFFRPSTLAMVGAGGFLPIFQRLIFRDGGYEMQVYDFNDLEGIRIAVEMERRGRDFYDAAARVAKSEQMREMLKKLKAEEIVHMQQFGRLHEREQQNAAAVKPYSRETSAFLTALAADIVFSNGLVAVGVKGGFEDPVIMLEEAIASEQDSIDFYSTMEREADDEHAKEIFREIIAQERSHQERLRAQLKKLGD